RDGVGRRLQGHARQGRRRHGVKRERWFACNPCAGHPQRARGRRPSGRPLLCPLTSLMFRSLRFRLPALFLAGIALTGLVSTLIAFGLFRNYTQSQARKELRREAAGLTDLYAEQARRTQERGTKPPFFAANRLEKASGNRLYYVGASFFSGQNSGLRQLPQSAVDFNAILRGKTLEFEFTPPGEHRTFLAVAHPLYLDKGG